MESRMPAIGTGVGRTTQPSLRARSGSALPQSSPPTSPANRATRQHSARRRNSPGVPFAVSVIVFIFVTSLLLIPGPPRAANLISPGLHGDGPSTRVRSARPRVLSYNARNFTLDYAPTRIVSGSVHYFRTLPPNWPGVLRAARAMGLNAIETYVPWNLHEPTPGKFVFSGMLDLRSFLEAAQEAGLMVLLRPGPYICAEWDLGGIPAWVLRNKGVKLRSMDPAFVQPMGRFFDAVAEQVRPYVGKPVVALQIENEYGAYGDDGQYMHTIKRMWETRGFRAPGVMFFTSDNGGFRSVLSGSPFRTSYVLKTINLETNIAAKIEMLRKIQPDGPPMIGEFWSGWYNHWGELHHTRSAEDVVEQVKTVLFDLEASINMYMFFGGTNFGFMNGANIDGPTNKYLPTTTSYDYDGFMSEDARIREEKYIPMQKMLRKFWKNVGNKEQLAAMPKKMPLPHLLSAYAGPLKLRESVPLLDLLNIAADGIVQSKFPISMEEVGPGYGYVLYRHDIDYEKYEDNTRALQLELGHVRDYAYIIADGMVAGTVDRNNELSTDRLRFKRTKLPAGTKRIDILVENRGRVNYGPKWLHDRKGLLGNVTLAGKTLEGFKIYSLSFTSAHEFLPTGGNEDTVQRLLDAIVGRNEHPPLKDKTSAPTLFRGTLWISPGTQNQFPDQILPGTYVRAFGRGVLWVNGFNVGRFHTGVPGPQRSLYVPGALLREGRNEFLVLHQNLFLVRGYPEPLLQMFAQADYGMPSVYDSREQSKD